MFIDFPKSDFVLKGLEDIVIPPMVKIRQKFDSSCIEDIRGHLISNMNETITDKEWYRDKRICITGGSRGISNIDLITKTVVDQLKEWGAKPFIIPAMGSHAGGTAEGQKEMLATFNITEESMGAEILSSMNVVQYSSLEDGTPLYIDKYAYNSDGIVIINKVKPHTNFHGKHESGLAKMMAIGLGKHVGSAMFHMKGFPTFAERIPQVCEEFLKCFKNVFAVGIVENAYDKICRLEVAPRENILEKDAELLQVAKKNMAHFKYPHMDVIVIDEMGKNVSGTGFDPNIISHEVLDYQQLFVRGLTEDTHHNACGIGFVDISTQRMLNDIDWDSTWTNIANSTVLYSGRIPMYANSDKEALLIAIRSCNNIDFNKAKIVRIKNTLHMDEIEVSLAYWEEIKDYEGIERIGEFREIQFDAEGYIIE